MAEAALCLVRPVLNALGSLLKKMTCNSVVAVVLPRHCGKSSFINSITAKDSLLLDIEENVQLEMSEGERTKLQTLSGNASYNLHYFPICRDYLNKVKKNHKFKKIIVLCSDLELCRYLGISAVFTFVPSNSLAKTLGEAFPEDQKARFEESRLSLLLGTKKIYTFNGFDDLHKMIIQRFKLQQKL